jgi:transcriptional regulator with XRE-family HTH domain
VPRQARLPDPKRGPLPEFAFLIRSKRLAQSLTMGTMAAACSVTEGQLGSWERGERFPPAEYIDLLARNLGLPDLLEQYEEARDRQRLLEQLRAAGLPPRLRRDSEGFVGRERELTLLRSAWKSAEAAKRRAVLIQGGDLVGKTALVGALAGTVDRDGGIVLLGSCKGDQEEYQPFLQALRGPFVAMCAGSRSLVDPSVSQRMRALMGIEQVDNGGSREDWISANDEVHNLLSSQRPELFEEVVSLLRRLTHYAPTLLVLDALQWAAPPTVEMMKYILRSGADIRLLLVGTCRLDPDAPLAEALSELIRLPTVKHIALGGLDEDSVKAMVGHKLEEGDEKASAVVSMVARRTLGNPYHIRQILDEFETRGYIRGKRWVSEVDPEDVPVPASSRHAVLRRFDRLSPNARTVLRFAAVAGPLLPLRVLEQLIPDATPTAEDLHHAVTELKEAGFLVDIHGEPGHCGFDLEITWRTIYEDIGSFLLPLRHHQVLKAFERLPRSTAVVRSLAYHSREAVAYGSVADAVRYAMEAATRALQRGLAVEDAIAFLTKAMEALEFDDEVRVAAESKLWFGLANAWLAKGDFGNYRSSAEACVAAARAAGNAQQLADAAALLTDWGVFVGHPDPFVVEVCSEAVELLGDSDPCRSARVMAGLALARAWADGEASTAERLGAQAVELARRSGDSEIIAYALLALVAVCQGSARLVEQEEAAKEALAVARRIGHPRLQVGALRARLRMSLESGKLISTEADLLELDRIAAKYRSWFAARTASMFRTVLALLRGDFTNARGLSEQMKQLSGEDPNYLNIYFGQQLFLSRELGHGDSWLEVLPGSESTEYTPVVFRAAKALLAAESGTREEAADIVEELSSHAFSGLPRRDSTWIGTLSLLANTCAVLEHSDLAQQLVGLLLPHSGHIVVVSTTALCNGAVDRYLGMLMSTMGNFDEADAYFESACALESRIGALPSLARTKSWYGKVLLLRAHEGDGERARSHLGEALTLAESCGMVGVASEVRRLLNGPSEEGR